MWASLHYFLASRTLRRDLETRYVPPAAALTAALAPKV
jgi:hypothetical protein